MLAWPAGRSGSVMNRVHHTAVIGPGVELGTGNTIGPYAVLLGPLLLGDDNWVGPHVVLGTPAEIAGTEHAAAWAGDQVGSGLRIGSRNVLREYTTIHQGHYGVTVVGDDCYLMNKVYVGHDGEIGDRVTMASSATLGGHVHVGSAANLGMGATVHQRRLIGPGAMVGMAAVVTRDLPPYALAYGSPCRVHGANRVGLDRAGVPRGWADALHIKYEAGSFTPPEPVPVQLAGGWEWWREQGGTPRPA